jgi:hypothetical protein
MKCIILTIIICLLVLEESKFLLNHSTRHTLSLKQDKKEKAKIRRIFFTLRNIAYLASLSYKSENIEKLEKSFKKPELKKWILVDSVYNQYHNSGAIVAIDPTSHTLMVSIKGTDNIWNFALDANSLYSNLNDINAPADTKVHSGFFTYFNSLVSEEYAREFKKNNFGNLDNMVIEGIRQLYLKQNETAPKSSTTKKYFFLNFIITGHSLGGACATLYAHHLMTKANNFPIFAELKKKGWHYNLNKGKIRLYTFGSPRVGNQIFTEYINNLIGKNNIFTVQYMSDPITAIPPEKLSYRHVGIIYLCFEPSEENKSHYSCSISHDHSISIEDQNILNERKGSWLKFWNRITFGDHGINNGYIYIGLSPKEYIKKKEYELSKLTLKKAYDGIIKTGIKKIKGIAKFFSPHGNFIKEAGESLPDYLI